MVVVPAVTVAENLSAPAQLPLAPTLGTPHPSRLPLVLDRFPGSDLAPVPCWRLGLVLRSHGCFGPLVEPRDLLPRGRGFGL